MARTGYAITQYRDDPLGFLISLMDLKRHESVLRNMPDSLYLLTGILMYRGLPPGEKTAVTGVVHGRQTNSNNSPQVRMAMSSLYALISAMPASPYWYSWSLTDEELREHYEISDEFASALEKIGIDSKVAVSVVTVATGLVSAAKDGFKGAAVSAVKDKLNMSLAKEGGRILGMPERPVKMFAKASALVTIYAALLHAQTRASADKAKRELMARGLLRYEEM